MLYKVVNYYYNSVMTEGKYRKHYVPGSIVSANKNTIGLMLFKDLESAIGYIYPNNDLSRILEVEPMGTITKVICISLGASEYALDCYYKEDQDAITSTPPFGTVCCRAIKVIREIEL